MAQEHNNSRDIGWNSNTTQWDKLGDAGLDLGDGSVWGTTWGVVPGVLFKHLSLDATGSNTVASDTLRATISSERSAETFVGGFGGGVECVVGDRHAGSDR